MPRRPPDTRWLAFAELSAADLDDMAALLGDPYVMRCYPRTKDRAEALAWIRWNQGLYREAGFGLWALRSRETGEFVGDCGLTPQEIDGTVEVEVGYHVRTALQGRGYATEAATACRDHARNELRVRRLIAIIHPDNVPSQRIAEKVGLRFERRTTSRAGQPVHVYAARL